MKHIYTIQTIMICLTILYTQHATSQGCVSIRSGCGANVNGSTLLGKNQIQIGTNARYFHSYKHFRGKEEETYRVEEGSEVINDSYFTDLLVSYGLTTRFSLNLAIPYVHHTRSSMYEHGGNPKADDPSTTAINEYWAGSRHTTGSSGLGDIRYSISYWLLDPATPRDFNFSVGLGMKLATGNYRVQDQFYHQGAEKNQTITSGVDQSIQLGDGGIGATIDIQGYFVVNNSVSLSTSLYYLSNPREQYTLEARGSRREYSIPDQYAARLGAVVMLPLHGLYFYGGGRVEGVPSSDLIGGDAGFRRPGYAISAEPGVSYGLRNLTMNLTVPIAVERNRTRSFSDKQSGRHGDAAFADYLINFGLTYKLMKHKTPDLINNQQYPISN